MINKVMLMGRQHGAMGKSIRFLSTAVAQPSSPQPKVNEVSLIHSDAFGDSPLKPSLSQWYYAFRIPQKVRKADWTWSHVYLFTKRQGEDEKRFRKAINRPSVAVALPVSPEGKFDPSLNSPILLSAISPEETLQPDPSLNFTTIISDNDCQKRHAEHLCNSLLLNTDNTLEGKSTQLFSKERIGSPLRQVLVDFYGWML